jgi:hypothetical protein
MKVMPTTWESHTRVPRRRRATSTSMGLCPWTDPRRTASRVASKTHTGVSRRRRVASTSTRLCPWTTAVAQGPAAVSVRAPKAVAASKGPAGMPATTVVAMGLAAPVAVLARVPATTLAVLPAGAPTMAAVAKGPVTPAVGPAGALVPAVKRDGRSEGEAARWRWHPRRCLWGHQRQPEGWRWPQPRLLE